MLVVGLHGWILPPGAILVCDIFVYSEFLIHPILLLGASGKMRREIIRGVKTGATVRIVWKLLLFLFDSLFHLDPALNCSFYEIRRKIFLLASLFLECFTFSCLL